MRKSLSQKKILSFIISRFFMQTRVPLFEIEDKEVTTGNVLGYIGHLKTNFLRRWKRELLLFDYTFHRDCDHLYHD